MKTKLIGSTLAALTVAAVVLYPAVRGTGAVAPDAKDAASRVEVVFVLDTTSSMTGLIETAKEKIWSIASTMAQAEQQPEIRMGLVAFRDRGDDYVAHVTDLSPDLDSMYATLMRLRAEGGGDGPESVNAALDAAVNRISWSNDQSSYKVVFLVGDAPPHMDYHGETQYPEIVRAAAARGIVVNTIQCGAVAQTTPVWTEIAQLGGGRYMQVEQSGGAFAVATPYDGELAELSIAVTASRLHYGNEAERATRESRVARSEAALAEASTAAQARRAVFSATGAGDASLFGDRDLVSAVESGRVSLDAIAQEDLPEPLQELDETERESAIAEIAEQRADLRRRIRSLSEARAAFIAEKAAESPGAAQSLERQIYDAVREQGAAKGLTYAAGPEY